MNTTTPAPKAGVAVKTMGSGFIQHPRSISRDWVCLEFLRPDDAFIDAALTYAELRTLVIPNPSLPGSGPLPAVKVEPYWRQSPLARVGLLVGHTFEALAVKEGPEQIGILERLGSDGLLDSCFAQAECPDETLLLFASSGQPCQQLGLKPQGVRVIGRSGRIDVTPANCRWLWVDVDAYGDPLDVDTVRQVLS